MDNPNFVFLKEYYPGIYKSCNMIDSSFVYSEGEYKYPVALSVLALEEIIKTELDKKSGDLFDLVNTYCDRKDVTEELCSALHFVRMEGNDAKHNVKSFNKKQAVKVVEKLHYCVQNVFDFYDKIPRYKEITGDEEWITPISKQESENYKLIYEKLIESENRTSDLEIKLNQVEDKLKNLLGEFELISKNTVKLDDLKELSNNNDIDGVKNKINEIESSLDTIKILEINNQISELSSIVSNLENIDEINNSLNELTEIKSKINEFDGLKVYIDQLMAIPDKYADLEEIKSKLSILENSIADFDDVEEIKLKLNELSNSSDIDELNEKLNQIIEFNNKSDYNSLIEEFNKLKISFDKIVDSNERTPDEYQRDAIEYNGNKLIINAGPGSGKTFVLIERVKYLVNKLGVSPESLLIITFTDKAAEELRDRLMHESGLNIDLIDQMQISTIHSACRVILKDYFSSGLEVIDDSDNERKRLFIKKYQEELGLTKYAFVPDKELGEVAKKFDEYSTLDIDTDRLEKNLEKKYFTNKRHLKKDQKYKDFIDAKIKEQGENFEFPINELDRNNQKRWIYNKHIAIVRAFNKYISLLDQIKSYDFNHLLNRTKSNMESSKKFSPEDLTSTLENNDNVKMDDTQAKFAAVNYLKENRDRIRFKNILVDEFQDTDEVQMKIFELLIEGSETVTFVGDPDQSIYGFRGSDNKFFSRLLNDEEFKRVDLLINYRTPQNIIDFNEDFIKNHGRMYEKGEVKSYKRDEGDLYYLDSINGAEEAQKILSIIKSMKKSGKIKKYSDVGLLFRTKRNMKPLINLLLKEKDIKFHVQGNSDFKEYAEVNSMMLLLWYLTNPMKNVGFDLKDFIRPSSKLDGDNVGFDLDMFNLDDSTKVIIKNYKNNASEFSNLTKNQLFELGIENDHDLDFFTQLNDLKHKIHSESKIEVLDVYYRLFKITNYIENKFKTISKDQLEENVEILNLGYLSRKINDYMETYSRDNVNDLFDMLFEYYTDYSSPKNSLNDDESLQLLTVHKAKGLEFPVVFVCSLKADYFPSSKRDNNFDSYPTPDHIKYPEIAKKYEIGGQFDELSFNRELNDKFIQEENRILFVALTRAISTLFVSHIEIANKKSPIFLEMLKKHPEMIKLTDDKLPELQNVKSLKKERPDELNLSFSSLEDYSECPHKYNLIYNYEFVNPQNVFMRVGTIVHSILNKLNTLAIEEEDVDEFIDPIIQESKESNSDLADNPYFTDIIDNLEDYLDESYEWKILESEYPFTIKRTNYNLKGQIDLMRRKSNGITLVDFKTTDSKSMDIDNTKYEDQLHFYHLAMRDNSKYKDVEDIDLKLFSLKDFEETPVVYKQERVNELEGRLNRVYTKITEKQYYPTDDGESKCRDCLLRNLCGKE